MDKLILLFSLALLAGIATVPARSAAQADSIRVHAGATFGFGSELKQEPEDDNIEIEDQDLVTTYGANLGVEVPLIDLFTIGAELGLAFWNTENRDDPPAGDPYDRHTQLDLLVRPKLRFVALDILELYAVVPFGYTHFIPSDDSDVAVAGLTADVEGGPGFAVGGAAGATLFLLDHLGVTLEAGYLYRRFAASVTVDGGVLGEREEELTGSFGQAQLRLGLTGAF